MSETALEFIVRKIVHQPDNNCHPLSLNSAQIDFLAEHWGETQKCITDLIVANEGYCFDYRKILEELKKKGVAPTEAYVQQNIYEPLITQKRFTDVAQFSGEIKILPSPEQAKRIWQAFFENEWRFYDLERLANYFGRPELSQEEVDKIGNDWLAEYAGERKKCIDVEPKNMKKVIEIIGTPQWNKNLAAKTYDRWLEGCWYWELFEFLRECIGVKPEEKKVREYYAKILSGKGKEDLSYNSYRDAQSTYEFLKNAVKATGVLPDENDVKNFYRTFLDCRSLEWMKKIEELTGVKLSDEDIQCVYKELLNKGRTEEINLLKNKTKIKPKLDEETVQEAYSTLFSKSKAEEALQVYLLTDIEPKVEQSLIPKACNRLIETYGKEVFGQQTIEVLRWTAGLFPNEAVPVIQEWIAEFISKEKFRYAKHLLHYLRIEPKACTEERFVLACNDADWKTAKELYAGNREKIDAKYPQYARVIECVVAE